MIQVIIAGVLLSLGLTVGAQVNKHGPPCGGMDILAVGVHIQGFETLDDNGIHYTEVNADYLRKGFTLALVDTSYKVKWFLINHESSNVIKEYAISGKTVTLETGAFLKSIKPGDQLSIECINIEKGGVTSLSTDYRVLISK